MGQEAGDKFTEDNLQNKKNRRNKIRVLQVKKE